MVGLTPKPDKMPQTIEEWKYLAELYEVVMEKQAKSNSVLRSTINTLRQKLKEKDNE